MSAATETTATPAALRREVTAYRCRVLRDRCYRELFALDKTNPADFARGVVIVRRIDHLEAIESAWRASRPFDPTGL